MHEGDEPDPLADLRHADILAGERMTEIHLVPLATDRAAVCDRDRHVMEGIGGQLLEAALISQRRKSSRTSHFSDITA